GADGQVGHGLAASLLTFSPGPYPPSAARLHHGRGGGAPFGIGCGGPPPATTGGSLGPRPAGSSPSYARSCAMRSAIGGWVSNARASQPWADSRSSRGSGDSIQRWAMAWLG